MYTLYEDLYLNQCNHFDDFKFISDKVYNCIFNDDNYSILLRDNMSDLDKYNIVRDLYDLYGYHRNEQEKQMNFAFENILIKVKNHRCKDRKEEIENKQYEIENTKYEFENISYPKLRKAAKMARRLSNGRTFEANGNSKKHIIIEAFQKADFTKKELQRLFH